MGFPSPAQDYVEECISLDKHIISRPAPTYFMRAGFTHYREGIISGALLVGCVQTRLSSMHFLRCWPNNSAVGIPPVSYCSVTHADAHSYILITISP